MASMHSPWIGQVCHYPVSCRLHAGLSPLGVKVGEAAGAGMLDSVHKHKL